MKKQKLTPKVVALFLTFTLLFSWAGFKTAPKAEAINFDTIQTVYDGIRSVAALTGDGDKPVSSDYWLYNILTGLVTALTRPFNGEMSGDDVRNNPEDEVRNAYVHSGYVPIASSLIYALSNNPGHISLARYKNHMLAKASAPLFTAHAQTLGRELLDPIIGIWQRMRNASYLVLAAVSVVAGFLIMVRKKIDPRTSVTVMYMLPRMVITLILITFSYPIAAFGIDIAFALIGIVSEFMMGGSGTVNIGEILANMNMMVYKNPLIGQSLSLFYSILALFAIVALVLALFAALVAVISRYARLLLMTAIGPIILVWDFLPGENKQTMSWAKGILANVAALPAMMGIFYLALALFDAVGSTSGLMEGLGFADVLGPFILPTIGVVLLWQVHKVPKAIDKALQGKDRLPGMYAPGFGDKR